MPTKKLINKIEFIFRISMKAGVRLELKRVTYFSNIYYHRLNNVGEFHYVVLTSLPLHTFVLP
jgi:hypothetical protein